MRVEARLGIPVGDLEGGTRAAVGPRGEVVAPGGLRLDWWVGADDGWHLPADEASTRQHRAGAAPVAVTEVRVPGGTVVQRVYGAGGPAGLVVVDVENSSPGPVVLALVLGVPRAARAVSGGSRVLLDGRPVLVLARPPGRVAVGPPVRVRAEVLGGNAAAGPLREEDLRPGEVVAVLVPVPHRTRARAGLVLGRDLADMVDARLLPEADGVIRGWATVLDRGMQVEVPEPYQRLAGAARADVLLTAAATGRPAAAVVIALEDWGFDAEAVAAFQRLSLRGRRRAARRSTALGDEFGELRAEAARASDRLLPPRGPEAFLALLRAVLLGEPDDGTVALLPGLPADWLGADLAVHDAPTRAGPVSFALRWHGRRPALLWDAPAARRLVAPTLAPGWEAAGGSGEALLPEPPPALLGLGATVPGQAVVPPTGGHPQSFT